jgi:DNA-binding CsgD family transcriptional regulator
MTLLERDALLSRLRAQWTAARAGSGRLVLVEGEAGIGKTSLVRAFARSLGDAAPVHWGACEAMQTPRPLGALDDIARQAGGALAALLAADTPRHRLFAAFVEMLGTRPALAVVEDLHWADEATLDLLRYAGRRIGRTGSLLVATYRSDELSPAHPLRAVIGDLATSGVLRLSPPPLSLAAVRGLCGEREIDAAALHGETAGNPFFVTEVLAADVPGVPPTVQDAVLARAGRLTAPARAVLDAAAIAGPRVEPSLLRALAEGDSVAARDDAIEECSYTGVLRHEGGVFVFRHELARQAVRQAMSATRAAGLHRQVLALLSSDEAARDEAARVDAARLAQHADGAADADAVRRWAPVAAREAAQRGAHREAAEHWACALKHLRQPADRAAALDRYAVEAHMSFGVGSALAPRREAAALWRTVGDTERAVASISELAMLHLLDGRCAEADAALHEARSLVAAGTRTPASGRVDACLAWLRVHDCAYDAAIALAEPALAHAERHGDASAIAVGCKTIGAALLSSGRADEGLAWLRRALAVAEAVRDDRSVGQVHASLGLGCVGALRLDDAEAFLRQGIEFCAERDLEAPRLHQVATSAQLHLLRGRWDDAAAAAQEVLRDRRATTIARTAALVALGRLRARRGDPGTAMALDEALGLAARASVQLQLACWRARAEAAWLDGRDRDAALEAAHGLPLAIERRHASSAAELSLWSRSGGARLDVPPWCGDHPCALEATGEWRAAADAWRAVGCPFEAARALAGGDEPAQREALAVFESLGARPMVERVRHRLRSAGVRGLPRGPRASTRRQPAGLTEKEATVLVLLAAGLRNKEIAARLHRSPRTIDHHLQAIFAKLGVATRAEAVGAAHRLGLVRSGAAA